MSNEKRYNLMRIFVRHEDITKDIIDICKATKPKNNCRGLHVPIPADPQMWKHDGFHGGWAMITGHN